VMWPSTEAGQGVGEGWPRRLIRLQGRFKAVLRGSQEVQRLGPRGRGQAEREEGWGGGGGGSGRRWGQQASRWQWSRAVGAESRRKNKEAKAGTYSYVK
jgi:hypothetical protein